jgi:hypothetical protein
MGKKMSTSVHGNYTLEFKLEALRLVKVGQSVPVTARILRMSKLQLSVDSSRPGCGPTPRDESRVQYGRGTVNSSGVLILAKAAESSKSTTVRSRLSSQLSILRPPVFR